jgi:thiol-disulfide isomerase/thioredoxin
MKLFHKLAVLALAAAVVGFIQQGTDPNEVLKQINAERAKAVADARAAGGAVNAVELQKNAVEKAKAAVKDVDPAKIDPKQGYAWAQLFAMAEMHQQACDSARRFLDTNPSPPEKFTAQSLMLRSCNALGEAHMLVMMIGEMAPPTNPMTYQLASMTANVYAETINKKMGADEALKALDKVESLLPAADKLEQQEARQRNAVFAMIAETRSEILTGAGKKDEARAAIEKAIASLGANAPEARSLKAGVLRTDMMNKTAPAITAERSYGTFAGLDSLKGKVVLLDFFAHWCGPCIASFPDMIKLYTDLKPKGLEIVGVTTYYGYYKTENREKRDMPRDVEFAKMGDFIAEYKLPWPVVYGERSNFEAYGITGIPHVTVLDREGRVHKFKIGYSVQSFAAFRQEIEALVNGK